MKIVAISNSKGGVGKTTLTAALAVEAEKAGGPVGILDTDPSSSLSEWHLRRSNTDGPDHPELLHGCDTVAEALDTIEASGPRWDWLFIDTPPGEVEEGEAAMRAADITIIPVRPSSLDIMSSELAVGTAVEITKKTKAPFLVVLNAIVATDELEESTRKIFTDAKIPVAKTAIRYRKAHIVSMTTGRTAREWKGGTDAAGDIAKLWGEILAALGVKK